MGGSKGSSGGAEVIDRKISSSFMVLGVDESLGCELMGGLNSYAGSPGLVLMYGAEGACNSWVMFSGGAEGNKAASRAAISSFDRG